VIPIPADSDTYLTAGASVLARKRSKLERAGLVDAVAEGVRRGLPLESAAALVGVHRSTLHRWLRAEPAGPDAELLESLQEAVAQAQAVNLAELVGVAHQLALAGDGNMLRFLLERRHGWRPDAGLEVRSATAQAETAEPVRYRITIPIVERIGEAPTAYGVTGADGLERLLTPAEAEAEGLLRD
jgi:transposase-like protein